jgi:HEAT repeat protein
METSILSLEKIGEKLHSPDEEVRRQAVVELALFPFQESKPLLLSVLGDSCWRVRKEAVELVVAAAGNDEQLVTELVEMLRSHDNAGLRNSAVESLEKLGDLSVGALCNIMDDVDHDVRKFAIDILGNIGNPSSIPFIVEALNDVDLNVKSAAAENLGKMRVSSALPSLLDVLINCDIWLKFIILEAIARIGMPVPVEILAPMASENILKKAIYECMGAVCGVEALPHLIAGLKENSRSIREAAVRAIVNIRRRMSPDTVFEGVDKLLINFKNISGIENILSLFEHADISLLEPLIYLIGIFGEAKTTPYILHLCQDDRLRAACTEAFRKMGKDGEEYLLKSYTDSDIEDRCQIVYLFGEMGCVESVDILRTGMSNPDKRLRLASVLSAGKICLSELIDVTISLLDDIDNEVRDGALYSLLSFAEIEQAKIAAVCNELFNSENSDKRRYAAILLSALSEIDKISLLVKDENSSVRKEAVNSLARFKSDAVARHLIMALMDEDSEIRIAAANALGGYSGEEVLRSLVIAIKDEDPWVQCAALKSLANHPSQESLIAVNELIKLSEGPVLITALETSALIGGVKANNAVKDALGSQDEDVVKVAIQILSKCGDEWISEYMDRLLTHPHWDVRISFAKAVADIWGVNAIPVLNNILGKETDPYVIKQIKELTGRLR